MSFFRSFFFVGDFRYQNFCVLGELVVGRFYEGGIAAGSHYLYLDGEGVALLIWNLNGGGSRLFSVRKVLGIGLVRLRGGVQERRQQPEFSDMNLPSFPARL